jgi:hypothetical protein
MMSVVSDPASAPDLGRPDLGSVLVTVVEAESADDQTAVARAVADRWRAMKWPRGLLSVSCFTSVDDHLLLTYAQWASRGGQHASPADGGFISRAAAHLVSGVRVHSSVEYVVYRGTIADPTAVPTFFSVDEFQTAGLEATHAWIDRALSLEAEAGAHAAPGAVSGHIHVSADGTRMLNLSGWVSRAAHAEFLADGSMLQVFAALGSPGTRGVGSNGYRLHTSLTPAPSAPR